MHNRDWGISLFDSIKAQKPDIIVFTGDIVNHNSKNFDVAISTIKQAQAIAPVYYVTGNHEAALKKYKDLEKALINAGAIVLKDEAIYLEKGQDKIKLIGLDDPDFENARGYEANMVENKLNKLIDKSYYNIVLCHRPELFESYLKTGANLILTGHAHGGQVIIPYIGGLFAPSQGLFPKYTEGLHNNGDTNMIISRGLGNSIIPVRVNNMPQLVVVELNSN